jgi:hypothetical protein
VRLEVPDHLHRSAIDLRVRDLDSRGSPSVDEPLDVILVHDLRGRGGVRQVGR